MSNADNNTPVSVEAIEQLIDRTLIRLRKSLTDGMRELVQKIEASGDIDGARATSEAVQAAIDAQLIEVENVVRHNLSDRLEHARNSN